MLDFHNHLMPGVDDGAANLDESRSGLATMRAQGITTIITTPHIAASLIGKPRELDAYLGILDDAFASLENLAEREFPDLRLFRGVEIMLDVPAPKLDDPRLRLAGGRYALCEFPFMTIPPHSTNALRELRMSGTVPILAHPERYSTMRTKMHLIEDWRDSGAGIQVNAGSLVGQYGATAQRLAWTILEHGWADYLSSDYHSRGRCAVHACREAMLERGAAAQYRALTVANPQRMLRSEAPLPVDPVEEAQLGFWSKLLGAAR